VRASLALSGRIAVVDIAIAHGQGHRPKEIQSLFSSRPLTLAEVHVALAYHYDHPKEMEEVIGRQVKKKTAFMKWIGGQLETDPRLARKVDDLVNEMKLHGIKSKVTGRRTFIKKLEDAIDVREARKVLAQMKRKEKPVPYDKVRRQRSLR
jgi:hypothetical protein